MNPAIPFQASPHGHRVSSLPVPLDILAIVAPLVAGCATVGRDIPDSQTSNIQIRKNSQEDIRSISGSPRHVGIEDSQLTRTNGKYFYLLFRKKAP